MGKKIWSYVSGLFLVSVCVVIGLWANLTLYGDPLAAAELTDSIVDSTTVLFTTLFIGLSGGHYIGGSFDKESHGRWFALGANTVLWLVIIGFIGLRATGEGNVILPAIYSAVLFFIGGGIFALHKSGVVENESKLDEYIGHFSSKGTGIIVTASFIVRTLPNPTAGAIAMAILLLAGALIWNAYDEQIQKAINWTDEVIQEITTTDETR